MPDAILIACCLWGGWVEFNLLIVVLAATVVVAARDATRVMVAARLRMSHLPGAIHSSWLAHPPLTDGMLIDDIPVGTGDTSTAGGRLPQFEEADNYRISSIYCGLAPSAEDSSI